MSGVAVPPQAAGRRWLVLAVVLSGAVLVIVAVGGVNLAVPAMRRTLHASFGEIQLVIAGYVLTYVVFLIAGGRLGDLWGRKRVLIAGAAIFTAGAAAGGLAPGTAALVLARMVQGLGAALMYPQFLSIIQDTFEGGERDRALAVFGATIGLGAVAGQLLGGAIISLDIAGLSWRPAFLDLVPIGLVTIVAAAALLTDRRSASREGGFDAAGTAVLGASLLLLVLPLLTGRDAGWPPWTLVALAASAPCFALFLAVERRVLARGRRPLLDPALFRQRAFTAGCLLGIAFMTGMAGLLFVTSLTLQIGAGASPLAAGLAQAPIGVAFFAASLLAPRLVTGLGRHVLSLGFAVVGLGLLATLAALRSSGAISPLALVPGFLVVGLGQGFAMTPLIGTVLAGVRREDVGSAAGGLPTAFQLGQVLGIAVVGLAFFAALGTQPAVAPVPARFAGAYETILLALVGLAALSLALVFTLPAGARANVFLERVPNRLAGLVYSFYFMTGGHAGQRMLDQMIQHTIGQRLARVEEAPRDPAEFLVHHYVRARDEDAGWLRYLVEEALALPEGPIPHERERQPVIDRQVEEISARQREGLIDEAFDPASLRLVAFALSSYPRLMPHVARMATGHPPGSPEFDERWQALLRKLGARLGPA
jgi:MFS family permease